VVTVTPAGSVETCSHNKQIHATRRIKDCSHGTERRRCECVIVFSDFDLYVRSVANTTGPISAAASVPKSTILRRHIEEILLLNEFFPIVDSALVAEI